VWNTNELETNVDLFKRSLDKPGVYSHYKLQEIDIDDVSDETYTKRIPTQEKPHSQVSKMASVEILVSEFEKVEGGFFSSAYVLYIVKIRNTEFMVKRKLSDFVWLREGLQKEFPVSIIPPLAYLENRPADVDYIAHQLDVFKVGLRDQEFLQEIVNSEELSRSDFIDSFLLVSDPLVFAEQKKQIDAIYSKRDFKSSTSRKVVEAGLPSLLNLEQLETCSKKVDLKISTDLKNYFRSFSSNLEQTRGWLVQLRELSIHLYESLKKTEFIYQDMGRICALIHQNSVEFNQINPVAENEVFDRVFFSLQNMFVLMGETSRREADVSRFTYFNLFRQWDRELGAVEEVPLPDPAAQDEEHSRLRILQLQERAQRKEGQALHQPERRAPVRRDHDEVHLRGQGKRELQRGQPQVPASRGTVCSPGDQDGQETRRLLRLRQQLDLRADPPLQLHAEPPIRELARRPEPHHELHKYPAQPHRGPAGGAPGRHPQETRVPVQNHPRILINFCLPL